MKNIILLIFISIGLQNCNPAQNTENKLDTSRLKKASEEEVEALVAQFIEAKEGETINIAEGFYELNTQLVLDKVNGVSIKGAGMYNTVLSFKNLSTGGEGMKIHGNDILLEGFTVIDAPGDDIKTQNCDNLTFRKINTTWSNADLSKSGTYGIYPVQCKHVLIEECEVSHSRDAGIYELEKTTCLKTLQV
jgi:parallel beta-helix repeat protein